ncbi:MAG: hypothetical protein COX66_07295 [Elusimicrobia bacterium CG_4_10_14_0_2_um_filter_63_34]|nr:MAG: hypothetical protein COX66_07295 [Elusimicrobia bacterium CG_4_10_14_0_2_um_filter_63_34]
MSAVDAVEPDAYTTGISSVSISVDPDGAERDALREFDWRPFRLPVGRHVVSVAAHDRSDEHERMHRTTIMVEPSDSVLRDIAAKGASSAVLRGLREGAFASRYREADRLVASGRNSIGTLLAGARDVDPLTRQLSVYALGRVGAAETRVIDELVLAFRDGNDGVRRIAAASVSRLGREAIPSLITALGYESPAVRQGAVRALVRMGTDAQPLVAHHLRDENTKVREGVALVFDKRNSIPAALVSDYIGALFSAIRGEQPEFRRKAWENLGKVEQKPEKLLPQMLATFDPDDRESAAAATAAIETVVLRLQDERTQLDRSEITGLVEFLNDEDTSVSIYTRAAAAIAVLELEPANADAVKVLKEALIPSYFRRVKNYRRALIRAGPAAFEHLADYVGAHRPDEIRDFEETQFDDPVDRLFLMTSSWSFAVLERILRDRSRDEIVRSRIPVLLAMMAPRASRTARALEFASFDRSTAVVSAAIRAVPLTDEKLQQWLVPVVHGAARSEEASVRREAFKALAQIWKSAYSTLEADRLSRDPELRRIYAAAAAERAMRIWRVSLSSTSRECKAFLEAEGRKLLGLLDDPDTETAMSALVAYRILDPKGQACDEGCRRRLNRLSTQNHSAAAMLLSCLGDRREAVVRTALHGLGVDSSVSLQFAGCYSVAGEADRLASYFRDYGGRLDSRVRGTLLWTIARSTWTGRVQFLKSTLKDPDPNMRRFALGVLASSKLDALTVSDAAGLVDDSDASVRMTAAESLGRIATKEPEARAVLDRAILGSDPAAKRGAMIALSSLPDAPGELLVEPLVNWIKKDSRDGKDVLHALRALHRVAPDDSRLFAEAVRYGERSYSDTVMVGRLLRSMGDRGRAAFLELCFRWGQQTNWKHILLQLKEDSIPPSEEEVILLLNSPIASSYMMDWLMRESSATVANLISVFPRLKAEGRKFAVWQLANKTPTLSGVAPLLRSVLKDEDAIVRTSAAEALAKVAGKAAFPEIAAMLVEGDGFDRDGLLSALAKSDPERAVPYLLFSFKSGMSTDSFVVRRALEKLDTPEALHALREAEEL